MSVDTNKNSALRHPLDGPAGSRRAKTPKDARPGLSIRRVQSTLADVVAEGADAIVYGAHARAPSGVFALLGPLIGSEPVEVFCALLLDGKQRVSAFVEVSRGTMTASLVHPREVFGAAVRLGAAAIIVAHNHPSGDPEPSAEDIAVTERLRQAGEILGIPLQDHVIVGRDSFVSLRERLRWTR